MTISNYSSILAIATLMSLQVWGQDSASVHKKIIGNWTLTRHTLSQNDTLKNMLTAGFTATYIFKANGTWTSTHWKSGYGTIETAGEWIVVGNGQKIHLHNNKYLPPNDKIGRVGDLNLHVITLSDSEFVTNEYLFSNNPAGTSYYKREK